MVFFCLSCRSKSLLPRPLCNYCEESMIPCPPLCSTCGSPECGALCVRPTVSLLPLSSVSGCFLALGQCYIILKQWKKCKSAMLTRWLKHSVLENYQRKAPNTRTKWICPIPSDSARAWHLGRNPAFEIAKWIQEIEGDHATIVPSLELFYSSHQAQRGSFERRLDHERFIWSRSVDFEKSPEEIILVDDFWTTGRTLRNAGRVLSKVLPGISLHGVVLGLRPYRRICCDTDFSPR